MSEETEIEDVLGRWLVSLDVEHFFPTGPDGELAPRSACDGVAASSCFVVKAGGVCKRCLEVATALRPVDPEVTVEELRGIVAVLTSRIYGPGSERRRVGAIVSAEEIAEVGPCSIRRGEPVSVVHEKPVFGTGPAWAIELLGPTG